MSLLRLKVKLVDDASVLTECSARKIIYPLDRKTTTTVGGVCEDLGRKLCLDANFHEVQAWHEDYLIPNWSTVSLYQEGEEAEFRIVSKVSSKSKTKKLRTSSSSAGCSSNVKAHCNGSQRELPNGIQHEEASDTSEASSTVRHQEEPKQSGSPSGHPQCPNKKLKVCDASSAVTHPSTTDVMRVLDDMDNPEQKRKKAMLDNEKLVQRLVSRSAVFQNIASLSFPSNSEKKNGPNQKQNSEDFSNATAFHKTTNYKRSKHIHFNDDDNSEGVQLAAEHSILCRTDNAVTKRKTLECAKIDATAAPTITAPVNVSREPKSSKDTLNSSPCSRDVESSAKASPIKEIQKPQGNNATSKSKQQQKSSCADSRRFIPTVFYRNNLRGANNAAVNAKAQPQKDQKNDNTNLQSQSQTSSCNNNNSYEASKVQAQTEQQLCETTRFTTTPSEPEVHARDKDVDSQENSVISDTDICNQLRSVPNCACVYENARHPQAYPPLHQPVVEHGDIIAYKIVELSECFVPEISKWTFAKVVSFDKTTSDIELEGLCCVLVDSDSSEQAFNLFPFAKQQQLDTEGGSSGPLLLNWKNCIEVKLVID